AVWSNVGSDNMTYINFASTTQNGEIVLYSDLIKVAVCMNNGRVCDMDAHLYLKNHKERKIPEVKIKVEDAERKLSKNLEVQTSRLALIPTPSNKEILAYEFSGIMQGETYYVYVNAITGEEEQIFKVVSTDDGDLLL
ncbi:MAG: germination protein YpeB, partial [Clostridia bacterium]|nr:germination protein YpeB [Clostridia bacterium]